MSESGDSNLDPNGELSASPDEGISFSDFVMGISTMALVHLGDAIHPELGTTQVDLRLAQENINVLGMLAEKTRGNLSDRERGLLLDSLYKLRMRFIEACQAGGEPAP